MTTRIPEPVVMGDCTLYLGDCLEILPTLGKVDAVITDPPYGIGFAAQPTTGGRKRGQQSEQWDNVTASGVSDLVGLASTVAIWGGNYYPLPTTRGWLCWYKPDAPPSMGDFELAWTNQDQNPAHITWAIAATNAERVGHPTQKPYRVTAWTLDQVSVPTGATVLDPFMGSGTTGIACIRTGRKFIGIEVDPTHFQTACDRIKREYDQLTLKL